MFVENVLDSDQVEQYVVQKNKQNSHVKNILYGLEKQHNTRIVLKIK